MAASPPSGPSHPSRPSRVDALPRVRLAHLPTPLLKIPALDQRLGVDLWIKRDDVTGGAESGNKLRKLELLLARAIADRADTIITCGGIQSNHARATALACARLRLRCVVFLRMTDESAPMPLSGNVLLDRFAGADVRRVNAQQYCDRETVMSEAAATLRARGQRPFVIPEGGSNALGSLGYVLAMREVREQLDAGLGEGRAFDVVVHACGSGGTAAGIALGAAQHRVAANVRAFAVCDDEAYFTKKVTELVEEAHALVDDLPWSPPFTIDDSARGPAYGVATPEQRAFIVDVARLSGVVLDPVYTGKAFFGLARAIRVGAIPLGARVLFVHTGGLPGLLAEPDTFRGVV
jgi:D-cysteine desulfhydrase